MKYNRFFDFNKDNIELSYFDIYFEKDDDSMIDDNIIIQQYQISISLVLYNIIELDIIFSYDHYEQNNIIYLDENSIIEVRIEVNNTVLYDESDTSYYIKRV